MWEKEIGFELIAPPNKSFDRSANSGAFIREA
jgi:hypothetical protein